ncbi:hypothetical protein FEM48_Zijuj09G0056100 [Ziziphus jujuba var. spinosa]|uniref:Ethylene-responsive transcription factor 1B-like n=1 Tax=Ziziphus jujuba var. spinosa TaxID=714518 RepID=A0A978UR67_ZIZJJ|nr:hypothetical protein FEM48_Zijuj09G0056100 [Ziziphus jujuba var. spinosa]
METSFLQFPTSKIFSPESSFGSPESFDWDELLSDHTIYSTSFPFNTNAADHVGVKETSVETNSSVEIKEEEVTSSVAKEERTVRQSLQEMKYQWEEGCSPVMTLKKKHSMRRKRISRKSKVKKEEVVVLEDLGAAYLEELLSLSSCESGSSS